MSQTIVLHPAYPDPQLLDAIIKGLHAGAVIAYPTDSGYALGCRLGLHKPLQRIEKIRKLPASHNYTLMCRSLSEIATYARVDTAMYRLMKRLLPGGYTFILPATQEVPKVMQPNKKTIGIRIPDHPVALAIVNTLDEPLLSTTLILPEQDEPLTDPEDVSDWVGEEVDIIIDGGYCGFEPTSVIDLTDGEPVLVREGSGDVSWIS